MATLTERGVRDQAFDQPDQQHPTLLINIGWPQPYIHWKRVAVLKLGTLPTLSVRLTQCFFLTSDLPSFFIPNGQYSYT
ncbi:hypothetical protein TGRH88_080500 [Toxoplasma gondii]|uniref:Uncharacterized protein n=1 Tax=Toxoplasma gondii TaxID=5811 RepID=A0A7J6K450_TOXGO|nr:hypothetical protein TGRH88_080500 [Toxoplasma gondii]